MLIKAVAWKIISPLLVTALTRCIEKYADKFDAVKAKEYVTEKIRDIVPTHMFLEETVEDGAITAACWVIDRLASVADGTNEYIKPVLQKIVAGDTSGAIVELRKIILSIIASQAKANEYEAQSEEVQIASFTEVFQERFLLEAKSEGAAEKNASGIKSETTEHKLS